MWQGWVACVAMAVAGCASARPGHGTAATPPSRPEYSEPAATALVFASPVALAEPPIYLWRDARTPSAFVSFDELSATFYHIRLDDRQTTDFTDRVIRRSVSERVGVSYR